MRSNWFAGALIAGLLTAAPAAEQPQLKYVVILSRHGVRSPTWETSRLNQYSADPWPEWGVAPGDLTPHGREAILRMGGYYHDWLTKEQLEGSDGCRSAQQIYIWADTDERTIETGRAFAESILPGCEIAIHSQPEGEKDPIFSGVGTPDPRVALKALQERLGSDPQKLIADHREAFGTLEHILSGGKTLSNNFIETNREVGAALKGEAVALNGPFDTGSTLSENFLLEYANGMKGADLGWGRLTEKNLLQILDIHAVYADIMRRTPYLARARGSNLLAHVLHSIEQAASGTKVPGSIGRPGDNILILAGHDTNQSNVSGMLDLNWKLPGYPPNETPPGGALIFSLWRSADDGALFGRIQYVAQSLDQIRSAAPLTASSPPEVTDVALPGCKSAQRAEGCPWQVFKSTLEAAIDGKYTN